MKIRVEQAHIDNGVEKDSHHCMIADAIKRAMPTVQYILVDLQSIRFSDPETRERVTYLTPPIAQSNLLKFDHGDRVKPFEFSLGRPVRRRGMGWKNQNNRTAANRRGAKRYRKTGKKRPVVAYKERQFGLRQFGEL